MPPYPICPICEKRSESRFLISHVRHKHTEYMTHLKTLQSMSHCAHGVLKDQYNEEAQYLIDLARMHKDKVPE
jgi:hypothetical protein